MKIVILVSVCFLWGCMTPKKAIDYLKKEKLLATVCKEDFPCITSSLDSSQFLETQAYLDSLLSVTIDSLGSKDISIDSLQHILSLVKNDSIVTMYINERLRANGAVSKLKVAERQINIYKNYHPAPVIQKIIDSAYCQSLRDQNDILIRRDQKLQEENDAYKNKVSGWKGKIGIPWYWFAIVALILAITIFIKLKK